MENPDPLQARNPEAAEPPPYATTVGEALARATRELADAGVDPPRRDAELLLAYVLAWEKGKEDLDLRLRLRGQRLEVVRDFRLRLLTHPDEPFPESASRFESFVAQRAGGRPVAYWLEAAEFMGLQFYVTRHVLIPRPETEILVEEALRRLEGVSEPLVLDVGTGSGCIGLSVAHYRPDATVWAVDVSAQALRVARKNARWLDVRERLHWKVMDFHRMDPDAHPPFRDAGSEPAPLFHAVLSNPPYIGVDEVDTLPPEVLREPPEALFAGEDGMMMIDALIKKSMPLLVDDGWLMVEVGHKQGEEAARRAREAGWREVDVLPDLSDIPRVLVARK
jgi:release factor glutamine methyltransferase